MAQRSEEVEQPPCVTCGHQPQATTKHFWSCDLCGDEFCVEAAGDEAPYTIWLDGHRESLVGPP
jgi:hypothetical protein